MAINTLKSGIYLITNQVNQKKYIGSAICLKDRFSAHKSALKYKRHENPRLQNSWNKHGKENFKFEVLVHCPKEYLIKMEQWFIDNLNPEYNICRIAGSNLGVRASEETKKKLSLIKLGIKQSDEWIKKRANSKTKPVYQYTLDGFFVKKYNSANDVAKDFGISDISVREVVLGRKASKITLCGFQFKGFYFEKIPAVRGKERRVIIYKDGSFVGVYSSLTKCAKHLNIQLTHLSAHLLGKYGHPRVGGYIAKIIADMEYKRLKTAE